MDEFPKRSDIITIIVKLTGVIETSPRVLETYTPILESLTRVLVGSPYLSWKRMT